MTALIIILFIGHSIGCLFLGALWYFNKYEKRKATGFTDCNGRPLFEGDTIQFLYPDYLEETGMGQITGIIIFENGAFVIHENSYRNYDWNRPVDRPVLLYDWLRDEKCTKLNPTTQKHFEHY